MQRGAHDSGLREDVEAVLADECAASAEAFRAPASPATALRDDDRFIDASSM